MSKRSAASADAPLLTPDQFYPAGQTLADICVVTFSRRLLEEARRTLPLRQISSVAFTSGVWPVYAYRAAQRTVALYLCPPGPACVVSSLEEIAYRTSAKHFVLFGAASSLNRLCTMSRVILPDAVRGEDATTRLLWPDTPLLPLPTAPDTQRFFAKEGIPFVTGHVWSCEALYHINHRMAEEKKLEGFLALDMHLAAAQAVCAAMGWGLYAFFLPGDLMDGERWEADQLQQANHAPEALSWALKMANSLPLSPLSRKAGASGGKKPSA